MAPDQHVELVQITARQVDEAAEFLHLNLNSRLTAKDWARGIRAPWISGSSHGYMLTAGATIVGVNLTFDSERHVDGQTLRVRNLGALCVHEDYRGHTVRLIRAATRQADATLTDLSPSGNVIEINERFGFVHLDTATRLVVNVPRLHSSNVVITTTHGMIRQQLAGPSLRVFEDHRDAPAAQHVLFGTRGQACHVMFRKDRRKGAALFATILYVSNPSLFPEISRMLFSHILRTYHLPFTLFEARLLPAWPRGFALARSRPKMFKSRVLAPSQIDNLYSELTQIAW